MSNIYEYIKMAIHNIMANKGRSFLTMLGIIIGIASVIAIVSIGEGTKNQMNSEIDDIGGCLPFFQGNAYTALRVSSPWALLLRRSRGRSRTVTHSGEGFQNLGHSPPVNGKRPCRNGQTGRGVSIGEMELEKGIIMLLGGEIARQSAGGAVRVRSRKFPLAI